MQMKEITYFKEVDNEGKIVDLLWFDYPIVIENDRFFKISKEEYDQLHKDLNIKPPHTKR